MTDYFSQFGLDSNKYGKYKTEINNAAEDGVVTEDELKGTGLSDEDISEIINASTQDETGVVGSGDIDLDAIDEDLAEQPANRPDVVTKDIASNLSAEELIAKKTEISDYIKSLETNKAGVEKDIEAAQRQLEIYIEQYDNECKKLEDTEKEYQEKQNKLEDLNENIIQTQKKETDDFNDEVNSTTANAIKNYNPEKDGDFGSFLDKALGRLTFSTDVLDSLNGDAKRLAEDMNGLASEMRDIAKNVRTFQGKIANQNNVIGQYNGKLEKINTDLGVQNTSLNAIKEQLKLTTGEGLTGTEVLASISDAEKDLVKNNNIDLTEKYENGNPKYVAAKGADGQFHIYEMDEKGENGTTLARKFGKDTGGLRGSDIVPSGSGYMRGATNVGEGEGRAVYAFSDVDECLTEGCAESTNKCYTTCSPLSFDVNGDGVKTSKEVVQFDIDGDGILDNVNNSSEWVLAFDKDKDGIAGEDGSELFGDNTDLDGDGKADGYANGFEALKALAAKEGLFGEGDSELNLDDISLLEEKYGLVMTKGYGGEASSIKDLGISNINLAETTETKLTKNFDGNHNDIMRQEGATFTVNGKTREYADIWNAKLDENGKAIEADVNTPETTEDSKTKDKEPRYSDKEVASMLNFADGVNQRVESVEGKVEYEEILAGAEVVKDIGENIEEEYYEELENQEEADKIEAEETQKNDLSEEESGFDFGFDNSDFIEYQRRNNKK